MHDKKGESIILDEEQGSWDRKWSEEDEKIEFWVFGRRRETFLLREIGEKRDKNREDPIYRKSQFLDGSRGIENLKDAF